MKAKPFFEMEPSTKSDIEHAKKVDSKKRREAKRRCNKNFVQHEIAMDGKDKRQVAED